jgi:hypothetical protein
MVIAIWVAIMVVWQTGRRSEPLASALLGTWATDDSRYAGRAMRITDSTLSFTTGSGPAQTYPIRRVRRSTDEGETVYEIQYTDPEGVLSVVLHWDPVAATVRLENPPDVIWRRSGR